ncbi:hypothetical protein [Kocuria marina]|uniref:hypothetical protein n=1 Tax=Kocuria marina TaxID=223184 RepID=UPI00346043A6
MSIMRKALTAATISIVTLNLAACGGGQNSNSNSSGNNGAMGSQSASECEGHDYRYPDLDPKACQETIKLVDSVIADGVADDHGVVRTTKAYCKPDGEEWRCGKLDGKNMVGENVRVVPKNSTDHPLKTVSHKSAA